MSDYELQSKLDQLTPENLLSVFRALLLAEISLDHIDDGLTETRWELVNPLGDEIGFGNVFQSDFGRGESGEIANINLRRVA